MYETYIKVKGRQLYLYRAIDKFDDTIDFMLTAKRDEAAALDTLNWQVWFAGIIGGLIEGTEASIAGVELWQMLRKGQMKNAGDMPILEQFYSPAA